MPIKDTNTPEEGNTNAASVGGNTAERTLPQGNSDTAADQGQTDAETYVVRTPDERPHGHGGRPIQD